MPQRRRALEGIRICDFTGQLAGAGATRHLAVFGAEVIRIEDPVNEGRWDILRGSPPWKDERRGIEFGTGFQNHNVEKLGVTLNLRTPEGKQLLRELIAISDAVTENFAAGVLAGWGFDYDTMRAIRPDLVYVSNCGFGHTGPYRTFKTWGPIVQAVSGLTFTSGLPDREPAGWGYSYMDHTGGYMMAIALLAALWHRARTGEGQWVDLSCTEAGATLHGAAILDWSVNGRPMRRAGMPHSNRSQSPAMAPHGIYKCEGDDNWIAISCRDDDEWRMLAAAVGLDADAYPTLADRLAHEDELDRTIDLWTSTRDRSAVAKELISAGLPAAAVTRPSERIDEDPAAEAFGLWPTVHHDAMGDVRVDGYPAHHSENDWRIERGAPLLGQHNDYVFGDLLGRSADDLQELADRGVI